MPKEPETLEDQREKVLYAKPRVFLTSGLEVAALYNCFRKCDTVADTVTEGAIPRGGKAVASRSWESGRFSRRSRIMGCSVSENRPLAFIA
jgi:hypothetical protein